MPCKKQRNVSELRAPGAHRVDLNVRFLHTHNLPLLFPKRAVVKPRIEKCERASRKRSSNIGLELPSEPLERSLIDFMQSLKCDRREYQKTLPTVSIT